MIQRGKDLIRILQKSPAGIIQDDPVAYTVKQRNADLALQPLDRLAQGRLGDMERLRRPGQMPVSRQFTKIL